MCITSPLLGVYTLDFSSLALVCDKTDNALTWETLHFAEYLSHLLAHVFRIMNY